MTETSLYRRCLRRRICILLAIATLPAACLAAEKPTKETRDDWQQRARVVADLGLKSGARIADSISSVDPPWATTTGTVPTDATKQVATRRHRRTIPFVDGVPRGRRWISGT